MQGQPCKVKRWEPGTGVLPTYRRFVQDQNVCWREEGACKADKLALSLRQI